MNRILTGMSALLVAVVPSIALAQDYPSRPITLNIAYTAGGTSDIGVRTWAPFLERCLGPGTTTVPVNIPGAGGQVGWVDLANADPDGHTIGLTLLPNLVTAVITKPDLPYNIDSFQYVGNLVGNAMTFSVRADSPIQNLHDLLAEARKAPINIGIASIGDEGFLLIKELMRLDPTLQFVPVPFNGVATVQPALLGGHVPVAASGMSGVIPNMKENLIRIIAVAEPEAVPELPGVETFVQNGFSVVQGGSRHIIAAPKGLPADVAKKLDDCFQQIAVDPEFLAQAKERALFLFPMNAADSDAFVRRVYEDLSKLWADDPWM